MVVWAFQKEDTKTVSVYREDQFGECLGWAEWKGDIARRTLRPSLRSDIYDPTEVGRGDREKTLSR